MKRMLLFAAIALSIITPAFCEEELAKDPYQLFYKGNSLYEKSDYKAAVEIYLSIIDKGLENGSLYYNIGNGFFRLGKLGYAILCYEKAKRFIPGDSDLKANLAFAASMVSYSVPPDEGKGGIARLLERAFGNYNLNAIAVLSLITYLLFFAILTVSIANPIIGRKIRALAFIAGLSFAVTVTGFSFKYYSEVISRRGIVVDKEVECKYEPIDKAATYYKLHEGEGVIIIRTRNGWRQIRRVDGKVAWAPKDAVQEI